MTAFYVIIGAAFVILWIIGMVNGGHKFDEQMRAQQLMEQARRRWPGKPLVESLDLLWRENIRKLKRAAKQGKDTEDLERDYGILLTERQKLIELAIESDSGYEAMPGRIVP